MKTLGKVGRTSAAMAAAAALLIGAGGLTAWADQVVNNVDATIDAVAEVMALNLGGANGSTALRVVTTDGDGKNGCNLTGQTTVVVGVSSSSTNVATVSPSSLTFDSCGATRTLTITPVATGSTTISLTLTSNNSQGSFDLAPATFTVNVSAPPPSNTGPTVSISGATMGGTYEHGSVPAATCDVTDAEDGNSSFPATLSAITGPLSSYGLGSQTASCSYTDGGGLPASSSVTYSIVDTTAPTITFVSRTPANGKGWNNTDVEVEWFCSDSVGVLSSSVTETVSTEGANQSATGTCTDVAGTTASETKSGINIDKTQPSISGSASPSANGKGWNNSDVTVNWSCSDSLSGVDAATVSAPAVLSSEGAGQSASGSCTDNAGNSSSTTVSEIDIDKTKPTVSLVGGPEDGGSYYFGFVPDAPSCTADDTLSGVDGDCSVTGYETTKGSQTVTASARDNAGNEGTDSATYSVDAWTISGFYRPVDMGGILNTVKGGSTVPLKFEVFAGSSELTDVEFVKPTFTIAKTICYAAATDAIEVVADTGSTAVRYDSVGGQFIKNWQTPKQSGACYAVTMTTDDGTSITANFKLK